MSERRLKIYRYPIFVSNKYVFLFYCQFYKRVFSRFFLSGNRAAIKGLLFGIALTTFAQLTANFTITCYAVIILEKAGTSLDPYISSIMLAVALILGSLLTTYLADILGRRVLNLVSLMGSAIGLFATSLYYYLNLIGYDLQLFACVPIVSLSFVIFISSVGVMPLAFICSVEYLPPKV